MRRKNGAFVLLHPRRTQETPDVSQKNPIALLEERRTKSSAAERSTHARANKNNFGAMEVHLPANTELIAIALLLPFLAAAVTTDMLSRSIPNVLVILMLFCGIALQALSLTLSNVLWSLAGVLVGFLVLIPFYAFGGMGAGDVKLLAALGSFLGPW